MDHHPACCKHQTVLVVCTDNLSNAHCSGLVQLKMLELRMMTSCIQVIWSFSHKAWKEAYSECGAKTQSCCQC